MKYFAYFKIFLCIVVLIFFVQIVSAEQIYIPGTAYGGYQYTAQQSGIYKFTIESGAVRGTGLHRGNLVWLLSDRPSVLVRHNRNICKQGDILGSDSFLVPGCSLIS